MNLQKIPTLITVHLDKAIYVNGRELWQAEALLTDRRIMIHSDLHYRVQQIVKMGREIKDEQHAARVAAGKNLVDLRQFVNDLNYGHDTRDERDARSELVRLIAQGNPDGIEVGGRKIIDLVTTILNDRQVSAA